MLLPKVAGAVAVRLERRALPAAIAAAACLRSRALQAAVKKQPLPKQRGEYYRKG